MKVIKKIKKNKDYEFFLWLIFLFFLTVVIVHFYNTNKSKQIEILKKSLGNIYLHKSIKAISSELEPRYNNINYTAKAGDTYESIINKLNVNEVEKKLFLKLIKKNKSLKILRIGQKFFFKVDKKNDPIIILFKIDTDKKNEIIFSRIKNKKNFESKLIEKNFDKILAYKEAKIASSLYNTSIKLGIKPNIIVEFARLYGFQVDFQRDIWKNDTFSNNL